SARPRRGHLGVDAAPAGMPLLGDARDVTAREARLDVEAGARVAGDLDADLLAQLQDGARLHALPVDAFESQVLADGSGRHRMALGLTGANRIDLEDT